MIKSLNQVMLYVQNQEQSVSFWTKDLGFVVKSKEELRENYKSIEVAPNLRSETSIVIFDKAFIEKYSPQVSLQTPSLMFRADNIHDLYDQLKMKGITVGEKVEISTGTVFNFADDEGNYFAVSG